MAEANCPKGMASATIGKLKKIALDSSQVTKNIWLDDINGYQDHLHCLISLNKDQSISKTAQLIKGESSFWTNKNHLAKNKFISQDDYWAVSVSENHIIEYRKHIEQQEEHYYIATQSSKLKS